jgi:hypothetical protein
LTPVRSLAEGLSSQTSSRAGAVGSPARISSRSVGSSAGATPGGGALASRAEALLSSAAAGGSILPAGYTTSPELPDVARLLAEGHGRLDNARVRALVLGLRGCLAGLPSRLRSLLELRTGARGTPPLSPTGVAMRLRIPKARVTPLELRALRQLRRLAETTGCAAVAQPEPGFSGFSFASYLSGPESAAGALGGVASFRYQQAPSQASQQPLPSPGGAPVTSGLAALRPSSSVLWILAGVGVLGLVMLLGILDGLGIGPRHRYRGGTGRRR